MEVILIKNGSPRIFLSAEDVIDEKFLELLNGGTCRLINNTKVEEDVMLNYGLLIEPSDYQPNPEKKGEWWNLWNLFKKNK